MTSKLALQTAVFLGIGALLAGCYHNRVPYGGQPGFVEPAGAQAPGAAAAGQWQPAISSDMKLEPAEAPPAQGGATMREPSGAQPSSSGQWQPAAPEARPAPIEGRTNNLNQAAPPLQSGTSVAEPSGAQTPASQQWEPGNALEAQPAPAPARTNQMNQAPVPSQAPPPQAGARVTEPAGAQAPSAVPSGTWIPGLRPSVPLEPDVNRGNWQPAVKESKVIEEPSGAQAPRVQQPLTSPKASTGVQSGARISEPAGAQAPVAAPSGNWIPGLRPSVPLEPDVNRGNWQPAVRDTTKLEP